MVQERNIVLAIILAIVTFGIYQLYWLYKIFEETRILANDNQGSAGLDLLLTIITCGLYGFYAVYQAGKRMYQVEVNRGIRASDDALLITILYFLVAIASAAILQSKINNVVGG